MANSNLHKAKKDANNEFYTQLTDIEDELYNYRNQFKNKVIFMNCDDPKSSNFWKYFENNFELLDIKKLISTHYKENGETYKLELNRGSGNVVKTPLKGNGDFRSNESIELLKEADMVITNPPFSLFGEYIEQLIEHGKKFIIIGAQAAITRQDIFKYLKTNKLWWGVKTPKRYEVPEYYDNPKKYKEKGKWFSDHGNHCWFTNLKHKKRNEELDLFMKYSKKEFPKYDNQDIIEIGRVVKIPKDYYGLMALPIAFMLKYNPKQFKLVGVMSTTKITETNLGYPILKGKRKFARVVIKRIK